MIVGISVVLLFFLTLMMNIGFCLGGILVLDRWNFSTEGKTAGMLQYTHVS